MNFDVSYSNWTVEMVKERLRILCKEFGKFPSESKLREINEYRLLNAIKTMKLSRVDLAIELGYKPNRMKDHYWTEDVIIKELEKLKKQYGKIPSNLAELGYNSLQKYLYSNNSIKYYQKLLGDKSRKIWSEEEILKEIQLTANILGRCPTTLEIAPCLRSAIKRSKNPFRYFQEKLGYAPKTKPNGYWKNFNNVKNEIMPYVKNRIMPTLQILRLNIGSVIARIVSDFGGISQIAEMMNCKVSPESFLTAKDGHKIESSYELEFDNYLYKNNIDHEVGGFIDRTKCKMKYDFKIKNTFIEIWGFNERPNNKRCVNYSEKRKKKEKFYIENNLRLVSIEGKVFRKTKDSRYKFFDEIITKIL